MDKGEALENAYRSKRKMYEEQEDELFNQRDQAVSVIDEVRDRSIYYLKGIVPVTDMLLPGLRQAEQMKEEIIELTKMNHRELSIKIEESDAYYYSKLRKLNDHKK